ncbi:NAD(P)/FAD-dependent oxidoreductase [Crassaminicella profunda]|uniref:NAD(P)/FAD-dependent oxidoreductase n=1 Tax=Crassaminicella profunda TaxID=1286698 RepID=UPI001CA7743E|nr:NAD(P)-binding protein [Crassaminicella profunda]QZY54576.1 NAD(P)-binding protein [Crassaminicella profunda]
MKVGIIGSGLAGLSCAFELKKYGIIPTIFEKRSYLGDGLDYTIVTLRIFDLYTQNPMDYFGEKYNLSISPLRPLRKIIMMGSDKKTTVRGRLGYIFEKSSTKNSLENQIMEQVNLPILFDHSINIEDLQNDFDYIVCANANHETAKSLNNWTTTFSAHTRIATVLGNFKTDTITMWLNTEYAKHGYAYLLPYHKDKANLALTVDNISSHELDYYWKKFLTLENLQYKILESRDIESNGGFTHTLKKDNIYLAGNAGGLLDDFLGFGSMNAIESGILAAKSIVKHLDYNHLLEHILIDQNKKHKLRKVFNTFDNKDLNKLITLLGFPIVKQYIYNNPFYRVTNSPSIQTFYNHKIKINQL